MAVVYRGVLYDPPYDPPEVHSLAERFAELEKERDSLLRLIGYVKSIVFSKVECSYASFKRPLEELLKEQEGGS